MCAFLWAVSRFHRLSVTLCFCLAGGKTSSRPTVKLLMKRKRKAAPVIGCEEKLTFQNSRFK